MSAKTARSTKAEANVVCPSHLEGSTLPPDWEWVSLGSVCRTTSGGTPSRKNKEYFEGDIPWVKSGELPDGPVLEIEEYITGEAVKSSSAKQFPQGTLLIALYGATVGKLGVLTQEAATNQAVCAIFPPDDIETKYLFWYLRFVRSDLIAQAIGGAQPNISQGILRNLLIPVAPLSKQKRIVAEIEKQFSRLDEAVANLKRFKANLKRYKASVLKAAVEGKLTEDWRKQHPNVEPASKLLERILKERRGKWTGKGKYKEPVEPDTNNLGSMPISWTWAALEQLCPRFVDSPHRTPRYGQTGLPALGPRDVVGGRLNVMDARLVDEAEYATQTERHVPEAGDIVYSRELSLGWGAILQPGVRVCLSQGMCLFRPHEAVNPRYFMIVLNGPHGRHQAELAASGSAHPHVNLSDIKKYSIPLPPNSEQNTIVAEVERRLSVIEELEAAVQANLTRAERLRQSILSRAFSGRLLGQEAKYIPEIMPALSIAAETQSRYGKDNRAGQ